MSSAVVDPFASPAMLPKVEEFSGVSLASRALTLSVRTTVRPFLEAWARTPTLPWPAAVVDRAGAALVPVAGTRRHRVPLERCSAEFLRAPGADGRTAVLYLHGGGFLCCGLSTHRQLASRISAEAGAPVLSVGYRLLPHHPIRAAVEDGIAGLRWLLGRGYPIGNIVIAGDSAGGFLSFAVAHEALRLGIGRACGTVAISPLTDIDARTKLEHANADLCALFPRRVIPVLARLVERAERNGRAEPVRSPVNLDLAGMPPALIQTGSEEMTFIDAELMAQRLAEAGVSTTLQVWEKQVHVFQAAAAVLPEGARAVAEIGRYIRDLDAARPV